ncbi:MAG: hypothetical protein FJ363_08845 [Gemmatimonadetes bacterium]|nr:hypothetical protein [Gemmatimonadota bacterium]
MPVAAPDVLRDAADALRQIIDRHGGASIGILGSARITCEEQALLRRLAATIGTPHLDSLQRHGCHSADVAGLATLDVASRVLVTGVDVMERHPQVGRRVREAALRGARVRFVASRHVRAEGLTVTTCLPGQEVASATLVADHDLVLWAADLALQGLGGPAIRQLAPFRAEYLRDYVNQLGLLGAGVHPQGGGASAFEMLHLAARGELKALIIFADDPFEFFPALAARAFAAAELVLVVDALETRSVLEAGLVLPGALLAEKTGTIESGGPQGSQRLEPVQPPVGGLTEGEVAERLIQLLGREEDRAPAHFTRGADAAAADAPSSNYPHIATLDVGTLWENHALAKATVTARRELLAGVTDYPDGYVAMAPADARALGLRAWAPARIESEAGAVTLTARLDPRVLEGTVALPMRLWESAGSALDALALDPCLRIPIFRPRAVRLSPG